MGTFGNRPLLKQEMMISAQIVHERSLWHNPLATGKFAMGTYGNFWKPHSTKAQNDDFSPNRARWSSHGELLRTLQSHENIMVSCIEFFAIWESSQKFPLGTSGSSLAYLQDFDGKGSHFQFRFNGNLKLSPFCEKQYRSKFRQEVCECWLSSTIQAILIGSQNRYCFSQNGERFLKKDCPSIRISFAVLKLWTL